MNRTPISREQVAPRHGGMLAVAMAGMLLATASAARGDTIASDGEFQLDADAKAGTVPTSFEDRFEARMARNLVHTMPADSEWSLAGYWVVRPDRTNLDGSIGRAYRTALYVERRDPVMRDDGESLLRYAIAATRMD